MGLEPTTPSLGSWYSTIELRPQAFKEVQNKPRSPQVSSDRPCGRRARDLRLTNARELVILRVPLKFFQRASFPSFILEKGEGPMAKGGKRVNIKLQSSESSHCYFTTKNKQNTNERLTLKKYDPVVRKHVQYKEAK